MFYFFISPPRRWSMLRRGSEIIIKKYNSLPPPPPRSDGPAREIDGPTIKGGGGDKSVQSEGRAYESVREPCPPPPPPFALF